jgi:hypothetical protein
MAKDDDVMMQSRMHHRGRGLVVIAAVVLLVLGMFGSAYILSRGESAPVVNVAPPIVNMGNTPVVDSIDTTATASQQVSPDLLVIDLHVQTQDSTASQAIADNAAVSADLLNKLEALGLTPADIQTTSYSVSPVTQSNTTCDASGNNCVYNSYTSGYSATNSLAVQLTDLAKGGAVIDAAGSTGTNQTFIDSISFTLQDQTRRLLEDSLLENASAEARNEAQSMAAGSGVALGKALSVSESYNDYYPQPVYEGVITPAASGAAPVPSTTLSPGQVEVSVSVSASYQIG